MIDHLSFSVNNFQESVKFYDATLKVLGFDRVMTFETKEHSVVGYGTDKKAFFWIGVEAKPNLGEHVGATRGFHIAFQAQDIESIQAWHTKCLEYGGTNNGEPGPRPEYHPGYYAAFIIDPNGYRLEAVLHTFKKG